MTNFFVYWILFIVQRFFTSFHLFAACSLTAIFLGPFAKPVAADTTGFLSLINSYRQQNGAGTLVEDQSLTNAACWFAADMGAKNYFPSDHVDSLGRGMSQRLTDFGISGSRAENIFYTTQGSGASFAFDAWKNSSGHNTNMLNSIYTRIGIGRASYNGKWYWVTDFANGTASTMTNQCGQATTPPTPSAPAPATPKKSTPAVAVQPAPVVETPVTTIEATPNTKPQPATKSATISTKRIEPKEEKKADITLVQGIAATTIVLLNLAIFGFITLQLYRNNKFLR